MTNEELNARINELWTATKRGELPRQARFDAIERLTDEYIEATDRRLDPAMLDRLATLCLYEEVTDNRSNKMKTEDLPIMSGNQYRRRKEGKHVRSELAAGEVTLKRAQEYGTDNRNYRYPNRRKLSTEEALSMDRMLPRDKEAAKRYLKESANGKVIVSYDDRN